MAADKEITRGHALLLGNGDRTVDVYHKFGFPIIVWGAVLPDITYRNKYGRHRVNGTMINQNDANAELLPRSDTVRSRDPRHDRLRQQPISISARRSRSSRARSPALGVAGLGQDFTAELTQIKALNPR